MPNRLVGSSAMGFVAQRLRNPTGLDLSHKTSSSLCSQESFILTRCGEPEGLAAHVNQAARRITLRPGQHRRRNHHGQCEE